MVDGTQVLDESAQHSHSLEPAQANLYRKFWKLSSQKKRDQGNPDIQKAVSVQHIQLLLVVGLTSARAIPHVKRCEGQAGCT